MRSSFSWSANRQRLRLLLQGPHLLAFLPALVLGAFWLGGEGWLLATALGLPLFFAFAWEGADAGATVPLKPQKLPDLVAETLQTALVGDRQFGLYLLQIDDFEKLEGYHGLTQRDALMTATLMRLEAALRPGDTIIRYGVGQFAVVLAPVPRLDLELSLQLARRMQEAVAEPHSVNGSTLYLTASVGLIMDRQLPAPAADAMIEGAKSALTQAALYNPGGLRAYSPSQGIEISSGSISLGDLREALENGAIRPWFQPQISAETGELTGVEALARWHHADQILSPSDFLAPMAAAGLLEQLGEVMLTRSLMALSHLDRQGLTIPRVGVNFSACELRNPDLAESIRWSLDRFDLLPGRLVVEILEDVVASSPDDMIVRNIRRLSEMGCSIDLDDFGTGHASITSLRRFSVNRIKIDRSFVTKLDRDPEQHKMVSAILSLTEQMGLDSLAEGVETAAEHSVLAQLGCQHVQGFGIARPMPPDQLEGWIRGRQGNMKGSREIDRRTG